MATYVHITLVAEDFSFTSRLDEMFNVFSVRHDR